MRRAMFMRCAVWLLAAGLVWLPAQVFGQDPAADVAAKVAAGEFGPALAAAGAVRDPAQRDKLLGQIAVAQAGAGARSASLDTAYDISSDLARRAALNQLGSQNGFGGARGGGSGADFTQLIDLITATISPDSWDDVGGPGSISGFDGGVFVDPTGLLKKFPPQTDRSLIAIRRSAAIASRGGNPRAGSVLRKVSLTRLEREVQLLHALGREPDEAMQTLAGLQRIQYLLFYPETGDIVIAGPAGDWRRDAEARFVDADKGRPVLNLDDLVVTLRAAYSDEGRFGCSINPRKDNLAAAQAVNDKWSKAPLKPGQRQKWLTEFRDAVGRQDIVVYGIDPRTRAARVLVEADYRMKLVGIGLEEGVLGVTNYLQTLQEKGGDPPPMSVLRWWFTLNYSSVSATEGRDAFELKGPGVKVLSENELLTAIGERQHTGASDELNSRFAQSFTKHFESLAAKYPVYADLRNIFDLALVAAVIKSHNLPQQVDWHMTHFGPQGDYQPAEVESVINHRTIGGRHVVAAVSGGVTVEPRVLATKSAVQTDIYGLLKTNRTASQPKQLVRRAWWWD